MLDWLQEHQAILYVLTGASVVMFVGSLLLVPALVVRIPPDYFAHTERPRGVWSDRHPLLRLVVRIGKNAVGVVLVLAGIAMLVLPGQGVLTLFIGFLMLDVPGKYRVERWVVSRRRIFETINWLRRRAGREPLVRPAPD